MPAKKQYGNEKGFTLVGVLAPSAMVIAAIRGNDNAYRVTESTNWAQDRPEALTGLPYAKERERA